VSQNFKSLIITSALIVGLSTSATFANSGEADFGPDVSIDLSVLKNLDANNIDSYSVPKEIAVPMNKKLLMPGMSHMSDEVILKEPDNKPVTLAPAKPKHKKVVAKKPQPAKTKAPEVSTEVKEIEVENKEPIKVITPSTTEDKISIPSEPVENKEMAEAHEEATSTVTTTEDKAITETSNDVEPETTPEAEETTSTNAPKSILPNEQVEVQTNTMPTVPNGSVKEAFDKDANLTVYFDHAASDLSDENKTLITTLISGVTDKENSLIKIRSYTSNPEDEKAARKTGMYRALNIRYLLSELGIHSGNIEFKLITEKPDNSYSDQLSLTIIAR